MKWEVEMEDGTLIELEATDEAVAMDEAENIQQQKEGHASGTCWAVGAERVDEW